MKTKLQVLEGARKLLEKKENWTKKASAKNKIGNVVDPSSPAATCWCSVGAIAREAFGEGNYNPNEFDHVLEIQTVHTFKKVNELKWLSPWNDAPTRTHEEVLAAFDKAIEWVKQNEADYAAGRI